MRGFVATPALVRFVLRRDRIRLPVWIGSILAITYASAEAVANTYNTPTEIASYAENLGNSPATIAMAGPPVALEQIGGILVYETSLTALLGTALMAAFTVVRHTRGEEEEGRTELLVSTVVGRHAGAAAAVLVAGVASVLVGLGVSGSMLGVGMAPHAAWLYGAAVAALGLVFASVAGVAAQLMSHGRSATGLVLAVLALSFLLRAVGDVQESAWSWLSPMGWSQQVRVLDENRWWPLLLSVGLTVVLLAATVVLATRRDVGSGIVPARPGPENAAAGLSSPLALAWRLQRGSVLAWAVGLFALGALFGSLSQEMQNMVRDNPTLAQYFEVTGGSVTDALFGSALLFNGLGAAAFAVASALRIRHAETAGTLEPVLATGVSRTRALLEPLVVTVVGSAVMLVVGAVGAALAWATQSGEFGPAVRLVGLALVYAPGVLALVGLAVALTGLFPRLAPVAWAGVAISFVIGWLGGLLDLPGWVNGLSPFDHLPLVPVEDLSVTPLVVLSLVAVALGAAGLWGFRRRDVT
ncbi:MAG: ABC transporter permease [Nocardioides sp.]